MSHTPDSTALAVPEPQTDPATTSNALLALQNIRFRIPGDVINAAVRDLPDEQRTAIKWFAGYCRARNLGPEQQAALLKKEDGSFYSHASIYAALTGRRSDQGVGLQNFCKAIATFRTDVEGTSRLGESGFIATRLSEEITSRCQRALKRKKIAFIFGDSQIGKTESLRHYQRTHNHGETIYVEAPAGGQLGVFLEELSRGLGIPSQQRIPDLRRRLIESFDPKMVLIVDEAHRFLSGRGEGGLLCFDFLRELYNRAGCGMCLSMTHEGKKNFLAGKHAKALEQLWMRRVAPLYLPKSVPKDDLDRFAMAYRLDPAGRDEVTIRTTSVDGDGKAREREFKEAPATIERKVTETEGLGVWITILQDATDLAAEKKKPITWGAVLRAYCASVADQEVWS